MKVPYERDISGKKELADSNFKRQGR